MAANSSNIKSVEECLEKFLWCPVAETLARTAVEFICKPEID